MNKPTSALEKEKLDRHNQLREEIDQLNLVKLKKLEEIEKLKFLSDPETGLNHFDIA